MTFYNRMQLIAYQVPTDRFYRENQVEKEEKRLPAGPTCLIASKKLDDMLDTMKAQLSPDALSRVMRMIAVAEKASGAVEVDPVANTLKVFMAPEFYFRPEEKGGDKSWSYTEEEKKLIVKALAQVFSDAKYASWLFVFGTIVWHEKLDAFLKRVPNLPQPQDKLLKKQADFPILWNTAILVEGGGGSARELNKLHYSGADDIEKRHWPQVIGQQQTMLDRLEKANQVKVQDYLVMSKKNGLATSILEVGDNLTLGVEICMDHALGVIAETLRATPKRIDGQLVTSCGIRVEEHGLVIGEKQFVFRMDGASTTPPEWKKPWHASEIQTVIGWTDDEKPIASSLYNVEQDVDPKKVAWDRLNVVDAGILLEKPLKLETGALRACHLTLGANDAVEQHQVSLDEACPQKLLVYHPVNLSSAVAQLVTDANAQQR